MTEITNAPVDFNQVQLALNVLSELYAKMTKTLKVVADDLNLNFDYWESHDYPKKTCLGQYPLWDEAYRPYSHLPLLHSTHRFVNFDLKSKELAKKGEAMVSLILSTNKACEEKPITLPTGVEALSYVYVFKAVADGQKTFKKLCDHCSYPDDVDHFGRQFDTKFQSLKCWAKTFDLVAFLSDPKPLIAEIRSNLPEA
ncbi:MAG: hypothetical protein LBI10_00535 [Deltaproteobacteria bacterium]|jgi:hypothetical protein|nr:hypothetical protein [Deltaproteobacteria bacterium]